MKTIKERLIKLIDGIFRIAVLSWVSLVIIAVITNNANHLFDWQFMSYSAAVYGLKLFFESKKIQGAL